MSTLTLKGNPTINVRLIRSSRAKRMSLRVSKLDGNVRLTLPNRCPRQDAVNFLADRADWVRKHTTTAPSKVYVATGIKIPFEGIQRTIRMHAIRGIKLIDDTIFIGGEEKTVPKRMEAFFKDRARASLTAATDHYAMKLGVSTGRLSFKDTKSRWGSCSSLGNINYSWRLVMAPPRVLQYVAAHEVSHRLEMNHSAKYWANVEKIFPDYPNCRDWLKNNASTLHSFRFGTL